MKPNDSLYRMFLHLITLITILLLSSCSTKEELTVENEPNIFLLLDKVTFESNSWKDVDKFYRNHISKFNNDELINRTIFYLSYPKLNFFEDAPPKVFAYYLNEAEKVEFNRNLRLLVRMLDVIESKSYWNAQKVSDYSEKMYNKNVTFWKTNFSGSIYLDKNKEALEDLLIYSKLGRD